ncbi:catalase family protein [Marilutibacter alkalisoli]|uniref:Uncharacterized protein n=1 Tax=Marilutibacter alkalisoli TaxID=2591633 RepID=A0A514BU07_9GAMM|nr:hypothetical protein [Lysobacter alkalisoli]QDH70891.1 hypothetical protein FKV23_12940 [Lysobacter alkalisoli]
MTRDDHLYWTADLEGTEVERLALNLAGIEPALDTILEAVGTLVDQEVGKALHHYLTHALASEHAPGQIRWTLDPSIDWTEEQFPPRTVIDLTEIAKQVAATGNPDYQERWCKALEAAAKVCRG